MSDAFYAEDGDRLLSSELTRGPWDPRAQHAGPPAALLARAIERCEPSDGALVGRITVETLRPVPLAPLAATARLVRPGRSVEFLEASLTGPDGEVMRASAWRLRVDPVELSPPPRGPATGAPGGDGAGLLQHRGGRRRLPPAIESRFIEGSFLELGPAVVWMRMRGPLVAGRSDAAPARAGGRRLETA